MIGVSRRDDSVSQVLALKAQKHYFLKKKEKNKTVVFILYKIGGGHVEEEEGACVWTSEDNLLSLCSPNRIELRLLGLATGVLTY